MIETKIILMGLACITILEIVALIQGINGILLTTVIAVIASVIGVTIPQPKILRKE